MIRLEQVVFKYEDMTMSFDADIPGGCFLAIIGPSGAGKSTLLNLIAGYEAPLSGRIVIGEVDMDGFAPHLRPVSMIFQDNNVFAHLDVWQNVAIGIAPSLRLNEAQRASVAAAMAKTGLAALAKRRPGEVSGGERQRIAIARALLKDPPILILDEATSSLDATTEAAVQAALDEVMRGRTTFVIAHRLATVRNADRILVFHEGRIVESGSFEELVRLRKRFAALAAAQFMIPMSDVSPATAPAPEGD